MRPEDAYPNSFRIGFGMLLVTLVWWVVDGGIAPFVVAAVVTLATMFAFPLILVWEMKRGE